MKLYRLKNPVTVTGKTMLGFKPCKVVFLPAKPGVQLGDPLELRLRDRRTELSFSNATIKPRRIETNFSGVKIAATEHYSPLRFLFPGIGIFCEGGELPHLTCTGHIIKALLDASYVEEVEPIWFTTNHFGSYHYPEMRGGMDASTFVTPNLENELVINITIKFEKFGRLRRRFVFPNTELMLKALCVEPLGTPAWLEKPAKLLWVHGKNTYWPREDEDTEVVLEKIIMHRLHDILGAIALLKPPRTGGFPSLTVESICSGHLGDYNVLHKLETVPI